MTEETKPEVKKVDQFALVKPDGGAAYPKMVGQKIENNKVVAGVVVNSPEEHKKWLKENSAVSEPKSDKPAWGQ